MTAETAPAPEPPPAGRPPRWRSVVAAALVVVAAVLAPLTVTAVWVRDHVLDTDGYVATVAPLADDPVVVDALATRIVGELFARIDVDDRLADVLPGPFDALGRSLSSSLQRFATEQTERVLASDAFGRLWEQANRAAHEQVVAMFTGDGDALRRQDDRIVVDLGVVADKVRQRLVDQGVGVLRRVSVPEGVVEVTILQSDLVPKLQPAFRALDELARVLPIAFVVVVVATIAVARRRRAVLVALGLAVAATAALLLVGLDLVRRESLEEAANLELNAAASEAVFDTLVATLRDWAWWTIGAALLVAIVAVVSDPRWVGRAAVRLRGAGPAAPPVAVWVRAHRPVLLVVASAIALVMLLVWPSPTWLVVAAVAVALGFALGAIVALSRLRGSAPEGAARAPEAVDEVG